MNPSQFKSIIISINGQMSSAVDWQIKAEDENGDH